MFASLSPSIIDNTIVLSIFSTHISINRGYTHSTNLTDIIYNYYGLYFHEHLHLPCIQNMIQCLEESDHDIWKGVKVMVRYCKQAHALITLGGKLIRAFIIEDV